MHRISSFINLYAETLQEALTDINTYFDKQLESETIHNFVIALIITTPLIGSLIFIGMVMLSA